MRNTEANQLWEATRRGIAEAMGEIDGALPGSVVVRHMRCGKAGCACKADPPGPTRPARPLPPVDPDRGRRDPHQVPQRGPARPVSTVVRQRPRPQGAHRDAPDRLGARRRDGRRLGHTGLGRLTIARPPTPIAPQHRPVGRRRRPHSPVPPAEPHPYQQPRALRARRGGAKIRWVAHVRAGLAMRLGRSENRPCALRLDAELTVVPVCLDISMVVEGFHGNRGLLPLSTRVRLLN